VTINRVLTLLSVLAATLVTPAELSASLILEATVGGDHYFLGLMTSGENRRNYLEFEIPQLPRNIKSATLEMKRGVWMYVNYDNSVDYSTNFSWFAAPSRNEFDSADLHSLKRYGTWLGVIGEGLKGSPDVVNRPSERGSGREAFAQFGLNQSAIHAVKDASGSTFRVGGAMYNFHEKDIEDFMFDVHGEVEGVRLILEFRETPEPASALTFVGGLSALVWLRRRRR
jgi:hypothetical protein